jgi:LPXTG-site transpeptidase (sortase) family protein
MVVRVHAESLWKSLLDAVADLMILAGTVCMLVWAWGMFEPALYQHVQKRQFDQEQHRLEYRTRAPELPLLAPSPPGLVRRKQPPPVSGLFSPDPLLLGEIGIPRLDWSVMVREGMDDATLRKAVGHVPATALPGEPGNFVVLGHRDTLFRPLRGLEQGDRVRMRTTDGDFDYRIDSIEVVSPEQVTLEGGPAERSITLVTCFPFDFIGPAPRRFVAHGHLEARSGASSSKEMSGP